MFEAYSHSNHEGLIAASCIEKEVRFGSKGEVSARPTHVCFGPRSGHPIVERTYRVAVMT
jgi:hypothetical protein